MTTNGPTKTTRNPRSAGALILLLAAILNLALAGVNTRYGTGWWYYLAPLQPPGIILHHSATPDVAEGQRVDVDFIDQMHARRGWGRAVGEQTYHIGYHYVILRDGTVQKGRPDWLPGAHTEKHNNQLGICLVGNFSSGANPRGTHGPTHPSQAQLDALDALLRRLIKKYNFTPQDLHRHRDYAQTACPGDRFPFEKVVKRAFR